MPEHRTVKVQWEHGGKILCILDFGTRWRWVITSLSGHLLPQLGEPVNWIGGHVCTKAGLGVIMKRNVSAYAKNQALIIKSVVSHYVD
jgi:hypothetical protein